MNATDAPKVAQTRTVDGILHFLTREQMAAEIVRLDAALAAQPPAPPVEWSVQILQDWDPRRLRLTIGVQSFDLDIHDEPDEPGRMEWHCAQLTGAMEKLTSQPPAVAAIPEGYAQRVIDELYENGDPVSVDAAELLTKMLAAVPQLSSEKNSLLSDPRPPAGQQDSAADKKSPGVVNFSFVTLWLEENCKRVSWSPDGASYEVSDGQAYELASIFAPATAGEATAAQGAEPKKVPVGEWLSITAELPPLGEEIWAQLDCPSGANYERHEMVCTAERDATRNRAIASFDFWSGTGWGIIVKWKRLTAPSPAAPGNGEGGK